MRPVIKGVQPAAYAPPANIQFAGGNVALMNTFFNTANPTVVQCLDLLLRKAKGQGPPPNTGTQLEMNQACSKIEGRLADIYKQAAVPLVTRIGPFCSYCETILHGLAEVEHTVPKGEFPTFYLSWTNFLIACGPCNVAKSHRDPDRATVEGWTGVANPTEQDCSDAIRDDHYAWPDLLSETYDWMPCGFYFDPAGANQELTDAQASNLANHVVGIDYTNQTVTADVDTGGGGLQQGLVDVLVQAANNGDPVRATEMIDLVALNNRGAQGTYDRRVMNRTHSWFAFLTLINGLENAATVAQFELLWPGVLMGARSYGFYSLAVILMGNFDAPDPNNPPPARISMAQRFVADTNDAIYYPGTNPADLP